MDLDDGTTPTFPVVAIFFEVPWNRLNQALRVVVELVTDEGALAQLQTVNGPIPARIEQQLVVGNLPGAPNGTPGTSSYTSPNLSS